MRCRSLLRKATWQVLQVNGWAEAPAGGWATVAIVCVVLSKGCLWVVVVRCRLSGIGRKLWASVWTRVRAGLKKCGKAFPDEVLEDASFASIEGKLKSSSSRGIPQAPGVITMWRNRTRVPTAATHKNL